MAESIQKQIEQLRTSINALEAQRGVLGAAIVDPILAASRQQLALLEQQAAAAEGDQGLSGPPADERRLVTILFTDMVGSTGMAEKLDPEEWRQVVSRMHTTLGEAVGAHHGTIAQYLGDGLLAFFGAREASEADPENAIRAALDAQAAVAGGQVQIRAGVHTGLVVVGELGAEIHKEFTASGDAMNLAARLQSAAPPGGILISHDTYRYVRGVFDVTPRPPLTVKGKSEPVQTYLVRRAKPRPFRTVTRGVAGVETRTVGREAEMQALQSAYLRAYQEHATVWAQLLGDPGMGKSRLLEDMNDWLDLREETYRLLRARAFPDDLSQPFALVRRLWFDRFQIAEDAPLEQAEAKWVERFKELSGLEEYEEPAHALGLLVGLPFENSPHIGAMRSDPSQVKGRALVVSRALIQAVLRQYPLVVQLEDLQWADAASWEYLMEVFLGIDAQDAVPTNTASGGVLAAGHAAGESTQNGHGGESTTTTQPNGLFILGVARLGWNPPQELAELFKASLPNVIASSSLPRAERRALGDDLHHEAARIPSQDEIASDWKNTSPRNDTISRGKWGTLIQLAPLTDQAMRDLAGEIFQQAQDIPAQVVDLLVERSEGVPYYAEEMVNWFIDHAILDTRGERWSFSTEKLKEQPLPATLQHLLLTRLSNLSPGERSALQRGAIFGRRFWTGGLEALGVPAGAEILKRLQPRGFVDAQPESAFLGEDEWSFRQNLLQEVTYESVLKRERATLHKVAAAWLEQQARQAGRLDEFAGLLGDHYERAGELSTAADWYLRAGNRAYLQGALSQALDRYTRALELLPPVDKERRWQVLLGREETVRILGKADLRKADIQAMLELAHAFGDDQHLAEAAFRQASYAFYMGDLGLSEQACREALAAARRLGDEALEARVTAFIASVADKQGDKSAALRNIEAALHLARRLGDDRVLENVIFRAAIIYSSLGDVARWSPLQHEQIELDRRLGNRVQEATGLGNLGNGYTRLGLYKQARLLTEQAQALDEAQGSRRYVAYDLANLGEICLATGDLRKARQLTEQAWQEILPSQDAEAKLFISCDLGWIQLAMGAWHAAARHFVEAHTLAESLGRPPWTCISASSLAACTVQQGQPDEARKYANEAWDYMKEHGRAGMEHFGKAYRYCAEVFDALGELEIYQAVLESAHRELMEVADTINVPEWRQSFLENVPENRAIMEMWERRKV